MANIENLRASIKRRLGRDTTASQAFVRGAGTQFLDNLLGLPDLAVTAAAQSAAAFTPREIPDGQASLNPINAAGMAVRDMTGGAIDPIAAGADFRARMPRLGQRVLGLPKTEDAAAMMRAGAQMPFQREAADVMGMAGRVLPGRLGEMAAEKGAQLEGAFQDQVQAERDEFGRLRENHPVAYPAGEIAGDVATVLTGRLPFAGKIGQMESAVANMRRANLAPGFRKLTDQVLKSDAMKSLYRGAGRAAETGLEGAVLATLKEGDPLEAGAFAAGAQAAGSGMLALTSYGLRGTLEQRALKLGTAAFAAGSLLQLTKELSPAGQENIFDIVQSMDEGFSKVAIGLTLGFATAGAGFGRIRGENLPKITDAITAIPRAGVMSVLTDILKEEEEGGTDIKRTIAHMAANPNAFNETQQKRLAAALEEGGDFAKTVKDLVAKDPRFVAVIEADPREMMKSTEDLRMDLKRRLGLAPRMEPPPRGYMGR